jgi:hypothetical protein
MTNAARRLAVQRWTESSAGSFIATSLAHYWTMS